MALTSKSPKAVVLAALATARRALPEYAHRFSPKKFTQHQLFACLVLKNFLRTDYRGLAAHLEDHPSLLAMLELKQVPHFTTFQKASHRLLLTGPARRLLEATVRLHMGRRRRVKRAAIDSTGLECSCASGYFVRRRKRVAEALGKPWFIIITPSWAWCAAPTIISSSPRKPVAGRGPTSTSSVRWWPKHCGSCGCRKWRPMPGTTPNPTTALRATSTACGPSFPPSTVAPPTSCRRGRYRRLMKVRFDRAAYRRRSQVETVISMIKRRQGAHVHGRSYHSQCRDLRLLVLTHNVMILVVVKVFYRAGHSTFLDRRLPSAVGRPKISLAFGRRFTVLGDT